MHLKTLFFIACFVFIQIDLQAGDITVIVKKNKQSTYSVPSIFYFEGREKVYCEVRNVKCSDTLRLTINAPIVEVDYFHSDGIHYCYPANVGDTLTISFVDDLPVASSTSKRWLSSDYLWQTNYTRGKSLEEGKDQIYYAINCKPKELPVKLKWYFQKSCLEFACKQSYLDSIFRLGELSPEVYTMQRYNIQYRKCNFTSDPYLSKYKDTLMYSDVLPLCDSLLFLRNYRRYLEETVRLNSGFYKDVRNYSYKKGFDWILKDTTIKGLSRNYLLFDFLKSVNDYCSSTDFEEACALFRKTVTDSIYLARLEDIALTELKKQTVGLPNELKLSDKGKVAMSLSTLLKKHRGNAIYIDFWASWCAPCRASMEAAAKLRKEYVGKNVVFIYLSMDTNFAAWQKAVASDLSANYTLSYLVVNPRQAKFVKENQIKSIPRYFLYDKQGRLVYSNAPGPEGEAIRKELDRLLK